MSLHLHKGGINITLPWMVACSKVLKTQNRNCILVLEAWCQWEIYRHNGNVGLTPLYFLWNSTDRSDEPDRVYVDVIQRSHDIVSYPKDLNATGEETCCLILPRITFMWKSSILWASQTCTKLEIIIFTRHRFHPYDVVYSEGDITCSYGCAIYTCTPIPHGNPNLESIWSIHETCGENQTLS